MLQQQIHARVELRKLLYGTCMQLAGVSMLHILVYTMLKCNYVMMQLILYVVRTHVASA